MFSRRLKTGYFILEGLNSFAVVYYFYYFYFFTHRSFGFDNKANLMLAALNGAVYACCAWYAGRFAQRFGYFLALKLGFGIMIGALTAGLFIGGASAAGQILVMLVTDVGMCLTWPTLEALVSEEESPAGLQHMVGVYNVIWATTAALASFSGGAMLEHLGPRSLFFIPVAIQVVQLGLTFWLEAQARVPRPVDWNAAPAASRIVNHERQLAPGDNPLTGAAVLTAPVRSSLHAKSFLRMAWLANPCGYIAINTLIAMMPGIAARLELSTMVAGFCAATWCFARLGAFVGLWLWTGWHYRMRWLLAAYVALIGTFAAAVLAPNLPVLVTAQILFGGAVGLLYYSSLFYSMDVGETKGEHGGIHEAVIGLGNCAGPAVGAAALQFLPQYSQSGAVAVSLLLVCGLGGLGFIWRQARS